MYDQPNVEYLDKELIDAIKEKQQEDMAFLKIENGTQPKKVVDKIRNAVDDLLSENHSKEILQEYALQLGVVWGCMVAERYGWSWQYLDFGENNKGIFLVSPQSFYCCPPLYFMDKVLLGNNKGLDGANDNTVLLLFNMIDGIENQKPPQKYQIIY